MANYPAPARITSPHNPAVKYVRSLERARVRREEGAYLAEGVRLVGEAFRGGQRATLVLYDPDLLSRSAAGSSLLAALPGWADRSYEVDERVLRAAAQTETPAGVLAVLALPRPPSLSSHRADRFGLILDGLADPGNAGAILRTAAATGVDYVVGTAGTVDFFAPKVVRAGMGAHFRLPLYSIEGWREIDEALPESDLVLAEVEGGESVFGFEWPERSALVIGSEAQGVSSEAKKRAARGVHIPMVRGVESLNASVAASIIIYQALGPSISG